MAKPVKSAVARVAAGLPPIILSSVTESCWQVMSTNRRPCCFPRGRGPMGTLNASSAEGGAASRSFSTHGLSKQTTGAMTQTPKPHYCNSSFLPINTNPAMRKFYLVR
ncbi:CAP (Cysteine-rich secretory proteins [Striga asiatica]|uniref:CAP (Cysteine-rich secretory proteins) n=1 Tax=Striga asiatica TaxID=4170 RepID=A0A5A7PKZ2_STRAF|nr:CAP (Cysteine-rich secretory proteins [Striga asiatica]